MLPDAALAVEFRHIDDLVPNPRNARVHDGAQIEQIARSIQEFGFTNPILVDEDGTIVAGHGRRMAALSLYESGAAIRLPSGRVIPEGTVPVIVASGWSEEQRRAYTLADNQLALNATWDDDLLRIELGELRDEEFDLELIGFGDKDIDRLLAEAVPVGPGDEPKGSLADRFGIAPFSVLNAREGWWQDRKRAWLALGIQSELGRGDAQTFQDGAQLGAGGLADQVAASANARRKANAVPGGAPMPLDRKKQGKANAEPGGSKMPAANYSKTKARGDSRGRAIA